MVGTTIDIQGGASMQSVGVQALRTAIWAIAGWLFIRLGTAAFGLVAFYALHGQFSAIVFLPVTFACFLIAVFALKMTAAGLQGLRS